LDRRFDCSQRSVPVPAGRNFPIPAFAFLCKITPVGQGAFGICACAGRPLPHILPGLPFLFSSPIPQQKVFVLNTLKNSGPDLRLFNIHYPTRPKFLSWLRFASALPCDLASQPATNITASLPEIVKLPILRQNSRFWYHRLDTPFFVVVRCPVFPPPTIKELFHTPKLEDCECMPPPLLSLPLLPRFFLNPFFFFFSLFFPSARAR